LSPLAERSPVRDPVKNSIIGFNRSHALVSFGDTSNGCVTNKSPYNNVAVLITKVSAKQDPTISIRRALISEFVKRFITDT